MLQPSQCHSIVGSNVTFSGRSSQSGPSGCGKHCPSVGSQNSPSLQSKLSAHPPPGLAHAEARQTSPASQHTKPSAPQRTPEGQGATHAPSKHSSPTSQQTAGVPQRSEDSQTSSPPVPPVPPPTPPCPASPPAPPRPTAPVPPEPPFPRSAPDPPDSPPQPTNRTTAKTHRSQVALIIK